MAETKAPSGIKIGKNTTENGTILKIDDVSRTYYDDKESYVEALKGIDLSIEDGEFVSIIGTSGCGKTTLLRLIAGLDRPESGHITLRGEEITAPDPDRGYVFQQGSLFPWLSVEQNIAIGLKARHVYRKDRGKVQFYVDLIGLTGFEKAYPHQISGGMAQRVAIARALINNPTVLLLDEPMGALDSFTRAEIQDKLLELKQANDTTMILVTHDIDEAIYLSDRIVVMTPRPGKIKETLNVKMPYPRDRGGEEFLSLRRDLLEKLALAHGNPQIDYFI